MKLSSPSSNIFKLFLLTITLIIFIATFSQLSAADVIDFSNLKPGTIQQSFLIKSLLIYEQTEENELEYLDYPFTNFSEPTIYYLNQIKGFDNNALAETAVYLLGESEEPRASIYNQEPVYCEAEETLTNGINGGFNNLRGATMIQMLAGNQNNSQIGLNVILSSHFIKTVSP